MVKLSSEQRRIVESDLDDAIQVVASAGAGKTRVLTERVRFILENTKRDGVIALTFTNKAAKEMQLVRVAAFRLPSILSNIHQQSCKRNAIQTVGL